MADEPTPRQIAIRLAAESPPTTVKPAVDLSYQPRVLTPRGDLDRIYETRFSREDAAAKDGVWAEICLFLQRFVIPGAPVLDVAADRGHFIRNIRASERWATDIRDVRRHLPPEIRFVQVTGTKMSTLLPPDYFGTVFMSNYLEHLADSDVVLEQLRQAHTVCRPGGRIVILQPNIRLVGGAYWDFLDHRTALTEKSLVEAAELAGFTTTRVITRFLPFTTKSRLPQAPSLVRLYLRLPVAWRLLGKQTLYVGERLAEPDVTDVLDGTDNVH
jgi:SAM-dependent methyltransferase